MTDYTDITNTTGLEYNTQRPKMIIPEYGRNVQNMINHCLTIEDREERNNCAKAIIKIMGQINPQLRDSEDYTHKLWAHLFIMSDFKLDVDSPYPKPSPEMFTVKPDRVEYPHNNIKYGHYGKILEDMVKATVEYPEGEAKEYLIKRLGNLFKTSYLLWNRDTVSDSVIVNHIKELSNGKITIKEEDLQDTSHILKSLKLKQSSNNNNKKKTNNNNNKNKNKRHKR